MKPFRPIGNDSDVVVCRHFRGLCCCAYSRSSSFSCPFSLSLSLSPLFISLSLLRTTRSNDAQNNCTSQCVCLFLGQSNENTVLFFSPRRTLGIVARKGSRLSVLSFVCLYKIAITFHPEICFIEPNQHCTQSTGEREMEKDIVQNTMAHDEFESQLFRFANQVFLCCVVSMRNEKSHKSLTYVEMCRFFPSLFYIHFSFL